MMSCVNPLSTPQLRLRGGVNGSIEVVIKEFDDRATVLARTVDDRRKGALARRDGESLASAAHEALRLRIPLVLELASSGADVLEGVDALHGWGTAAAAVAACSGIVPIIAVATGPVISGPALLLGLSDIVVMTPSALAFVSGPNMVTAFTGVAIDPIELGGVAVHVGMSGLCAVETDDIDTAVSEILSYFPNHCDEEAALVPSDDPLTRANLELREVVPDRDSASYDVRDVARSIVDDSDLFELWAGWAPQIVTTLGRIGGRSVGILANQPRAMAGTLDIAASQKGARFVRLCDAFNFPIVTLVDTPGFLPGKDLEWRGMIRHGAELAFAYAEATVPRVCVILRKAFGGAYIVMDSKGLGNDLCLAWPGAKIAVMGAPGAVQILHRRSNPEDRSRLEDEYTQQYLTPWPAAERGFVDGVIDPGETRSILASSIELLCTKREKLVGRKHDAGPL